MLIHIWDRKVSNTALGLLRHRDLLYVKEGKPSCGSTAHRSSVGLTDRIWNSLWVKLRKFSPSDVHCCRCHPKQKLNPRDHSGVAGVTKEAQGWKQGGLTSMEGLIRNSWSCSVLISELIASNIPTHHILASGNLPPPLHDRVEDVILQNTDN